MTLGVQTLSRAAMSEARLCPQLALRLELIRVGRQEGFELSTKGLQIPRSTD